MQDSAMLCLAITGFDADPERVTELLQIAPTKVARKGTVSQNGRPHRSNGWWFELNPAKLIDGARHDAALNVLVKRLRGSAERFQKLHEALRPMSVTIYGGLYVEHGKQCGVWLDPEQMRVLSDCSIGWGVDVFVNDQIPKMTQTS